MKNACSNHGRRIRMASFMFFVLFAFTASGQDSLNWINKNAYEIHSNPTLGNNDLSFLLKELNGKTVVGLGEASHGTREFYVQKARIIAYLINHCNFKLLAFEVPQSLITPINIYVQSREGNLKEFMAKIGLYNTEEIYNLFQLISQYNKDKALDEKVVITGFDHKDYWPDPYSRDKYMTENLVKSYEVKKSKTIVWTHNVHIMKDTTSNSLAMGSYLNQHFKNAFYSIGFDTFKGTVNVLNNGEFEEHHFQAKEGTLSTLFEQVKYKSFFLPFPFESPFNGKTIHITNIYSNWQEFKPLPIKPGVDFDGIIFIRDTSASVKLSKE
ncbi:erythromycin esterase family protein [Pedobacter sp.]|uniref:erythromycin esterase family protein n=1 Tax=Pedobacter sp. TaxID=1411316 RepID=UPI003D7FEBAD